MASLPLAPPLQPSVARAAAGGGLCGAGDESAFRLDIEPGFASSIWPAAGVGTAALLVWGLRLWPGVLLGSFYFNWWLSVVLDDGQPEHWAMRVLVAAAIGGGVTLQALTSAGLGRPLLASGRRASQRPAGGALPDRRRPGVVPALGNDRRGGALGPGRPARRRSVRQLVHVVDGRLDRRPAAGAADVAGAARSAPPALAPGVPRRVPA